MRIRFPFPCRVRVSVSQPIISAYSVIFSAADEDEMIVVTGSALHPLCTGLAMYAASF